MIPIARHTVKSQLTTGRLFWIASILVFLSAIRRELSFIPKMFIPKTYLILGHSYYWWQNLVLLSIALCALAFLAYSWRYVWGIFKTTPNALYVIVTTLIITQYLGENSIGFSHDIGVLVEEVSEATIYLIALVYVWRFPLQEFECQLKLPPISKHKSHFFTKHHHHIFK